MSDTDTLSFPIAMSERERVALAAFISNTYKPANKAERKAMRLAFKRLHFDVIVARLNAGGIKSDTLSDKQTVTPVNTETVAWIIERINKTASDGSNSLIISELEDRFEEINAGTYLLPADLQKPPQ
jgi:hypothetical protein